MSLEELRDGFLKIEAERFTIINGYIMGIVKKSEIDRFEKALFDACAAPHARLGGFFRSFLGTGFCRKSFFKMLRGCHEN